jgi:hypothetical protein
MHSTAQIIQKMLVDMGHGTLPTSRGAWPIARYKEMDRPDNVLTIYNTSGRDYGRRHRDGKRSQTKGFQVRVRSEDQDDGYIKLQTIQLAMDAVHMRQVNVEDSSYVVQTITTTGPPLSIGEDVPKSKRSIHTLNGLALVFTLD